MVKFPLIAIDLGSSSIKMMSSTIGKKPKIQAVGLEVLPRENTANNKEGDEELAKDRVADTIVSLMKRLKINSFGRRVALSLGGGDVLIKRAVVPNLNDLELQEQIQVLAEQSFYADLNEVYWEYFLFRNHISASGEVPVLMTAVERGIVDSKIDLINRAGLKAGVVDCEVFSLLNMFEFNYGVFDQIIPILNIGARKTQVSLVLNGMYIYTRDIQLGGETYTQGVAEALSVDLDHAEALKISASAGDQSVPNEVLQVISRINQEFVGQVRIALQDFKDTEPGYENAPLENIFLVGGGAPILGLNQALSTQLMCNVNYVNPFQNFAGFGRGINVQTMQSQAHLYGVAAGLTLRQMGDAEKRV